VLLSISLLVSPSFTNKGDGEFCVLAAFFCWSIVTHKTTTKKFRVLKKIYNSEKVQNKLKVLTASNNFLPKLNLVSTKKMEATKMTPIAARRDGTEK